jgi:hypothetical protein
MTTLFSLTLPQHDAQLLYLAVVYHLARPGSEVDPHTLTEYEHGLAEVRPALEPQLGGESATVELTPFQMARLNTAMLSVINELHAYSLFDNVAAGIERPRSVVVGFGETVRRLFPQVAEDALYASRLAEDLVMLRRQLSASIKRAGELAEEGRAAAGERKAAKKPWQFWRR